MTKCEKHEVDFFCIQLFFIPEFYELTHQLNRNTRKESESELYMRQIKKRLLLLVI